jgi:hypothetical protein
LTTTRPMPLARSSCGSGGWPRNASSVSSSIHLQFAVVDGCFAAEQPGDTREVMAA